MMLIEILGAGCSSCRHLETAVREAASRSGQDVEVRRITDFYEISKRKAMSMPGLVIDGRVVSAGRIPTIGQIEAWIRDATLVEAR